MNVHLFVLLLFFLKTLGAVWTLSRICEMIRPSAACVLAVLLSIAIIPGELPKWTALPAASQVSIFEAMGLALLSVVSGVLVAWPHTFVFEVIPMSARLIDVCRGAQHAEQIMPGAESRSSTLETIAGVGVAYFYFSCGGVQLLVGELARPGAGTRERYLSLESPSPEVIAAILGLSLEAMVALALPVAALLLLFDCASALLARFAVRLPISSELPVFRLTLGLGILLLFFPDGFQTVASDLVSAVLDVLAVSGS